MLIELKSFFTLKNDFNSYIIVLDYFLGIFKESISAGSKNIF